LTLAVHDHVFILAIRSARAFGLATPIFDIGRAAETRGGVAVRLY
jgi:hypothetical protein